MQPNRQKGTAMKPQPNPPSDHRAIRPTRAIRTVVTWLVESDRRFRAMQNMVDHDHRF